MQKQTNMNEHDEVTIDLVPVFKAIGKKLWLVILIAILTAISSFLINTYLVTPTYRSGFSLYVNNRSHTSSTDALSSGDISASKQLVQTYSSIITSRPVIEKALDKSSLNYKYEYLKNGKLITTETVPGTEIIKVYVELESAKDAKKLSESIAKVAPKFISNIVVGSSMKIIEEPLLPEKQFTPNIKKQTLLWGVVGALLMMVLIAIQEIYDKRIKSEASLEMKYDIPVIGTIPNIVDSYKVKNQNEYYGGK